VTARLRAAPDRCAAEDGCAAVDNSAFFTFGAVLRRDDAGRLFCPMAGGLLCITFAAAI